ncbi:hypothetical protein AB0H63_21280 [Micromonospora echinospora]|uniref:hypothetical protein n=1 Tax=Micromonospora echinospora TaxID=1877 RepID=UPI0033FFBE8F
MAGVAIWDRFLGREVDAPKGRDPLGRYTFVPGTRPVTIAGQPAEPGRYLASGTGPWRLTTERGRSGLAGDFGTDPLPGDVTVDTVIAIGGHVREVYERAESVGTMLALSPLLADADARLRESALERAVDEGLGSLRAVCFRPATRLRPVHELVPASRSRRITPQTIARLAAHSEDWVRLRPDGVRPDRVLSPTREFDTDLYENRVAARLVDHLWRFLNKRITEVRRIDWMVEDAKRLATEIAQRPWRTHEHLFDLFAGFVNDDTWQTRTVERLVALERLSHAVASLMGSPVHRGVNRHAELGMLLRSTNIFVNDDRYRRVGELWQAWLKTHAGTTLQSDLARHVQQWCDSFAHYNALLLMRAFDQLGLETDRSQPAPGPGGTVTFEGRHGPVSLEWHEDGAFVVRRGAEVALRIVPIPHALAASSQQGGNAALLTHLHRAPVATPTLVLYPGNRDEREGDRVAREILLRAFEGPESPAPARLPVPVFLLPVSPLEIDSVTRIARALRWVIDAPRLSAYPPVVACTDEEGQAIVRNTSWLAVAPEGLRGVRPPADHELAAVRTATLALREETSRLRRRGANVERVEQLWHSLDRAAGYLTGLTWCPVCDKPAARPERRLQPRPDGTYRCECESCGSAWESRLCRACRNTYPVLIPMQQASTGGYGDHLDRVFGAELLASPCWIRDRVFICPRCTTCAERESERSVSCDRCGDVQTVRGG